MTHNCFLVNDISIQLFFFIIYIHCHFTDAGLYIRYLQIQAAAMLAWLNARTCMLMSHGIGLLIADLLNVKMYFVKQLASECQYGG